MRTHLLDLATWDHFDPVAQGHRRVRRRGPEKLKKQCAMDRAANEYRPPRPAPDLDRHVCHLGILTRTTLQMQIIYINQAAVQQQEITKWVSNF